MARRLLSVTPENFEELARLTGRSMQWLEDRYHDDVILNNISYLNVEEHMMSSKRLGQCYYNYVWNPKKGPDGRWVCVMHGQESKHHIDPGSVMPCLALDPYP